jgi:hypothetical protein
MLNIYMKNFKKFLEEAVTTTSAMAPPSFFSNPFGGGGKPPPGWTRDDGSIVDTPRGPVWHWRGDDLRPTSVPGVPGSPHHGPPSPKPEIPPGYPGSNQQGPPKPLGREPLMPRLPGGFIFYQDWDDYRRFLEYWFQQQQDSGAFDFLGWTTQQLLAWWADRIREQQDNWWRHHRPDVYQYKPRFMK